MGHDDWLRLYRLLAAAGMGRPAVDVAAPDGGDATLPLGWPELKVGIGFDHTDPRPFERVGWTLVRLSSQLSRELPSALVFVDELLFAAALHRAEADATQTVSRTERALLDRLLRAGLPQPDRNHRICGDDGQLVTVPDFVRADRSVAVFLDGHGGQSLEELLRQVGDDAKRRKAVKERWKNKSALDADKRRWMTARGWTVLTVSDKTVDDGEEALAAAVDDVVAAYRRAGETSAG